MSSGQDAEAAPAVCTPCRGTGKLISGLGGTPHEVVCPWCRGTGERIPGIDAQESPAETGAPPAGD
jgi:DnaJ-class molecular chaperone